MEVRMEDMSRLSLFTPKRSSQNLESSWDKPRRWPAAWKKDMMRGILVGQERKAMGADRGLHMQQEDKTLHRYQMCDIRQHSPDSDADRHQHPHACPGLFLTWCANAHPCLPISWATVNAA